LISRKKAVYAPSEYLLSYLDRYGRAPNEGIRYEDLTRHADEVPLYDQEGNDTLWSTVFFQGTEQREIHDQLRLTYAILKSGGDLSAVKDLYIDRIDKCLYGNTLPYRVRIVNALNENYDYFYVKRADSNRIYGLELEHILSPSRINYYTNDGTLIEEHIIGIPAELFVKEMMPTNRFDLVRLSKEFVKFNERCFVRLLGDMHAGNFVVDMRLDFEKWHYLMRPIDFDQQSHHYSKKVYLPQFYHQNNDIVKVVLEYQNAENRLQYQKEERALIAKRVRVSHGRFDALIEIMREDIISPEGHVERLRTQLAEHYAAPEFDTCRTMGDLVHTSIRLLVDGRHAVLRV
jgi:hypothetical protein